VNQPIKHFAHQPGSPAMEEVPQSDTAAREAVVEAPRCNIWWFLLIAGGIIGIWLCALTARHLDMQNQVGESRATQAEQYKHILYRLDEIDKKLDKRGSSAKMGTSAG
jgi:hypothetical protein